uniref:Uncharacterized protein n=1 Tax=Arundo donax TaxID=35708 RepID=A0A0A8YN85_ARUDO
MKPITPNKSTDTVSLTSTVWFSAGATTTTKPFGRHFLLNFLLLYILHENCYFCTPSF